MSESLRQADIARKLGVTRNYVNQLVQEPDWPEPVRPMYWQLDDVRRFFRRRAVASKPSALICATCGGDLYED
jgi:hypothetical protein